MRIKIITIAYILILLYGSVEGEYKVTVMLADLYAHMPNYWLSHIRIS